MCRAMWRVTPPTTTHARVSIGAHHEQVRTLVGEAGENLIANTDIWCHHSLPRCLDSVASKASRDPQVSSQSRPPIAPRPVDNHHPRGSVAVGGLQFLCCSTWLRGSALRRASSASAILDQHSHKASKFLLVKRPNLGRASGTAASLPAHHWSCSSLWQGT
jgi:hypothetical protein